MINGDRGAQLFQAFDVKVDGARSDRASSRQGDTGVAEAREQWAQHQHRSPHLLYQFVGRDGIDEPASLNLHAVAVFFVGKGGINAQFFEQAAHGGDVTDARNVAQHHTLVRKQRRRYRWQRGVLCAADRNAAFEGSPPFNKKLVHRSDFRNCWKTSGVVILSVPKASLRGLRALRKGGSSCPLPSAAPPPCSRRPTAA